MIKKVSALPPKTTEPSLKTLWLAEIFFFLNNANQELTIMAL